jgi:hypothetical protein
MFRAQRAHPQPAKPAEEDVRVISGSVSRGTPAKPAPLPGMLASPALEWLWKYLSDVGSPHILDCGKFNHSTAEILLRRAGRLYVADIIAPLIENDARLWDRSRKLRVFRTDDFLAQLPSVASGSLSLVLCWQVLDLLPRDSLAPFILKTHDYLRPGGVFFCLLREPQLSKGADSGWRLGNLVTLQKNREGNLPFPYPAITSREIERLLPSGNAKTFLTRAGFREIVALK